MTENYWDNKPPSAENLRLLCRGEGWKAFSDKMGEDGKTIESQGSGELIQSSFLNALNVSNLILLTGAGASLSAVDAQGKRLAPGMKDLWNTVKIAVGDSTFNSVCAKFPAAPIKENIEKLLSLCKIYLEMNETAKDNAAKQIRQFVDDAEKSILRRVDFVSGGTFIDAHSIVVRKISRRGIHKPRAKFFTTNYDLCFEEAARRSRSTVIDGFSHALDQVYDRSHFDHDIVRREAGKEAPNYIENVFHLYKLHGSLDWRRIGSEIVRSRSEHGDPVLIYPRSSKYQEAFEAPYLDMMGAFQAALREPDTAIIVSGFGFNDDHISRPVLSAVEANLSLRLIICDPVFVSSDALTEGNHVILDDPQPRNAFINSIAQFVESGDPRVHLINGRFSDLAIALPDLVGETDRERHLNRVRAVRDSNSRENS